MQNCPTEQEQLGDSMQEPIEVPTLPDVSTMIGGNDDDDKLSLYNHCDGALATTTTKTTMD
jgi:hypothetical protein